MTSSRKVLIADDHRLFAEGLAMLLREGKCLTEIETQLDAIGWRIDNERPDLLILDLAFGDESAMPLLRRLREERPKLPILVISASEEPVIIERVTATGAGYLAKSRAGMDLRRIVDGIFAGVLPAAPKPATRRRQLVGRGRGAIIGGVHLSRAQIVVLRLLHRGDSNNEIARQLNRAVKTVESHISELYNRTGLSTRGHLIRWANQHAKALGVIADGPEPA